MERTKLPRRKQTITCPGHRCLEKAHDGGTKRTRQWHHARRCPHPNLVTLLCPVCTARHEAAAQPVSVEISQPGEHRMVLQINHQPEENTPMGAMKTLSTTTKTRKAQRVASAKTKADAIAAEPPAPEATPVQQAAAKADEASKRKARKTRPLAVVMPDPPAPVAEPEAATPAPEAKPLPLTPLRPENAPHLEPLTPLVEPDGVRIIAYVHREPKGYRACVRIKTPTAHYRKILPDGLRGDPTEAMAAAQEWRATIVSSGTLPEPGRPPKPSPAKSGRNPAKVMPGVTRVIVD